MMMVTTAMSARSSPYVSTPSFRLATAWNAKPQTLSNIDDAKTSTAWRSMTLARSRSTNAAMGDFDGAGASDACTTRLLTSRA
jgi:hypothetical protein